MDGVGADGTIRVDTVASDTDGKGGRGGFAYVDTLVLWSVRQACKRQHAAGCDAAEAMLVQRRAQHPVLRWDDPANGRHSKWPQTSH